MNEFTISTIKADVGSIGGHTLPSREMLIASKENMEQAVSEGLILDFDVTHTGDDLCLLMLHKQGKNSPQIHDLAWHVFSIAADIAKLHGLYGAGQDLLKDAPSGNVRGAGPGAAEITFDMDARERPAEAFLVFTADKCGPGAYNFPLWSVFTNPMYCMGLMLPKMIKGFTFKIIDMEYKGGEKYIELYSPEEIFYLAALLRDENRYGIQAIYSRKYANQQIVAASTDRLHTIAGVYKGKDDPVAIIRTQGIFPAPEEVVSPYQIAHYVAGDARGSHHMPLMPVAINTAVTGAYCLPLVACVAYSVSKRGKLSEGVDMFGNPAWDFARQRAQQKAFEMRLQGFVGPAMLPIQELEYGELKQILNDLDSRFTVNS
jgi:fructose 1,6-bisphosphate aldolase/phosphatase